MFANSQIFAASLYMAEIEGVAKRIFYLRKSANKKQEDVGEAIGLTKSGISSFEKGKSIPSPENLVRLAALFEVSVDYLLTGREGKVFASNSARQSGAVEKALSENEALVDQELGDRELYQASDLTEHHDRFSLNTLNNPLPIFDQVQIDKRCLTELDRLLKANVIPTYTAWAQAVGVSPNYIAAIVKGRYHFNLELLYNTARLFPDFDFIYVVFGSALSARPEPTELPKRGRGRPKKAKD
jgi:transcriptional regulator with XRE-family HTH domain